MSRATRVARAGATAFVLGLTLIGPQAVGVASADTSSDSDSTSVSAGPDTQSSDAGEATSTRGSTATRTGPRAATTGEARPRRASSSGASSRKARAASIAASRAAAPQSRPVPPAAGAVVPGSGSTSSGSVTPSPSPSLPSFDPVEIASAAARSVGPILTAVLNRLDLPICETCSEIRPTPPTQTVQATGFSLHDLMNTVGTGLSSLPGNPVSDLLSGALWLTRRSMSPVGVVVDQWGPAACLVAGECAGREMSVAPLAGAALAWSTLTGATFNLAGFNGTSLTGDDITDAFLVLVSLALAYLALSNLTGFALTGTDSKAMKLAYADRTGVATTGDDLKWPSHFVADLASNDLYGTQPAGIAWEPSFSADGAAGLPTASKNIVHSSRANVPTFAAWIAGMLHIPSPSRAA